MLPLSVLFAEAPSEKPFLRIEAGMHTALITAIAMDASGRLLATASLDKTARIWDLADWTAGGVPEPVRILRPPIGAGAEGAIYAIALSADGKTAAAAGHTGTAWGKTAIYLFDVDSGELRKRLSLRVSDAVNRLAFSKDGRYLAAALGGRGGIRLFDSAEDYAFVAGDTDFKGPSYGLDFDREGRLAASAYDGTVRLYGDGYRKGSKASPKRVSPLAARQTRAGRQPAGLAFSPDGKSLAVGFNDSPGVVVLDARDLAVRFTPDPGGVNGPLSAVAWSTDGSFLFAGGKNALKGRFAVRRWTAGGRNPVDVAAAGDTLTAILPHGERGALFSSAEPSFGVIDAAGKPGRVRAPVTADFRGHREGLRLSSDGSIVDFSFKNGGEAPARFSVFGRSLIPDPPPASELAGPALSAKGLVVSDWKNDTRPKLNGRGLVLDLDERSRSLSVEPGGRGFLLGTERRLRRYDARGARIWERPVPGPAWAVNVAGKEPLVSAALGDGTIRWYSLQSGAELLALFPHPDGRRWVMWTPTGYYDASVNGEDLIGWHVNNGPDKAASFYSAGQFRSLYSAPRVVAEILDRFNEDEAVRVGLKQARRELDKGLLPPGFVLLGEPEVAGLDVAVRYRVADAAGGPPGEDASVAVLFDGRPVHAATPPSGGEGTMRFTVPRTSGLLSFITKSRFAVGRPVSIALGKPDPRDFTPRARSAFKASARSSAKPSAPEVGGLPNLWILAVGVSRFLDKATNPLSFAHLDAQAFVESMKKQQGKLYAKVSAGRPLLNELATKNNIEEGLQWLSRVTGPGDVGVVYMSSHGTTDDKGNYLFVNYDAGKDAGSLLSGEKIRDILGKARGKLVVFLDTCHSGEVMGANRGVNVDGFVNQLASPESGVVVFTAATGSQLSYEYPACGHGIFTQALLEGVEGRAAYRDDKATIGSLDDYIWGKVSWVSKKANTVQTPSSAKPYLMPNFPLASSIPESQRTKICFPRP
ncbi:MAG: caspase family protein [Elusimicrobia bacterium]|nr:caspase family protein [Elusimicrobiota bacterium]